VLQLRGATGIPDPLQQEARLKTKNFLGSFCKTASVLFILTNGRQGERTQQFTLRQAPPVRPFSESGVITSYTRLLAS
jgi:hypothetical protein